MSIIVTRIISFFTSQLPKDIRTPLTSAPTLSVHDDFEEFGKQLVTGEIPLDIMGSLFVSALLGSYLISWVLFFSNQPQFLLLVYAVFVSLLAVVLVLQDLSFFGFLLISVSLGAVSVLFLFATMSTPSLAHSLVPGKGECHPQSLQFMILLPFFAILLISPSSSFMPYSTGQSSAVSVFAELVAECYPIVLFILGLLLLCGSILPSLFLIPTSGEKVRPRNYSISCLPVCMFYFHTTVDPVPPSFVSELSFIWFDLMDLFSDDYLDLAFEAFTINNPFLGIDFDDADAFFFYVFFTGLCVLLMGGPDNNDDRRPPLIFFDELELDFDEEDEFEDEKTRARKRLLRKRDKPRPCPF